MNITVFIYRAIRKIYLSVLGIRNSILTYLILKGNQVDYGDNLVSNGFPSVDVWRQGVLVIGRNFKMNNGSKYNKIGRQQQCIFVVKSNAVLTFGDNVGLSSTAIVCHDRITIGNNVKIGGNTVIYDTDFHSLDAMERVDPVSDKLNTKTKRVTIEDNVFIGAHSTILKGVNIGTNSIIGACSVVTKSIPPNEVWAGNPAKFLKAIQNDD